MNPTSLAIFAYIWWGFVPVYWKLLKDFPAEELILYRVLFSAIFLLALIYHTKKWRAFLSLKENRKTIVGLLISGLLIGLNWFLYVWAVNNGHVVDASLGYFMNPILNMALGAFLLKENLRKWQKVASIFALLGTLLLVYFTGVFPWIALVLAFSFAFYGLIRKKVKVDTLSGTLWETILLTPPCFLVLLWLAATQQSYVPSANNSALIILTFSGAITTIPLLAFAEAAKSLTLTTMGFIQFISPTIQFLLGIFVFHELFDLPRFFAFMMIWAGLGFFLLDLYIYSQKKPSSSH